MANIPKDQFLPGVGVEYLKKISAQAGVANNPAVLRVLNWFSAGTISAGKLAMAERYILGIGVKQRSEVPEQKQIEPEATIGSLPDGRRWGPKLKALVQHLVVAGASGSGKSWLLLLLMRAIKLAANAVGWSVHIMAFDFKRDLRRIVRVFPDFVVIRWTDLRLDIFRNPPGVALNEWKQIVCDFLGESFGLRQPTQYLLIQLVDALYASFAPETTGKYPCLFDLLDLAKQRVESPETPASDKSKIWTLLNKLDPICRRIPDVVGVSQGFCIKVLLGHDIVIELDGLSLDLQKFIVTCLRAQAFHYYLSNNMSDGRLRTVVFVDEAGQTMSKNSKEGADTEKTTIRMSRSTGLAHVIAHQILKDIAEDNRANAGTHILKRLAFAPDLREAKTTLGLSDDLVRILQSMPVHMAIVKGHDEPDPFPIILDELPAELTRPLFDEELKSIGRAPLSVFGDSVRQREQPEAAPQVGEHQLLGWDHGRAAKVRPVSDWKTLLRFVYAHPELGIVELYSGMGLAVATGDRLKRQWVANDLVIIEKSRPAGPGKPRSHLRLTKKGLDYITENGAGPDQQGAL